MTDVTRILSRIKQGDPSAAEQLLPLVYSELKRLAERQLQREPAGHTLQPTALVHEAYVRLVEQDGAPQWNHQGHFFAACAEAMRRILVENARRKRRIKRGGNRKRVELDPDQIAEPVRREDLLCLHEALAKLEIAHERKAALVKLRYFGGLTVQQAAKALGVSVATAEREWAYARVWLLRELTADDDAMPS